MKYQLSFSKYNKSFIPYRFANFSYCLFHKKILGNTLLPYTKYNLIQNTHTKVNETKLQRNITATWGNHTYTYTNENIFNNIYAYYIILYQYTNNTSV
jgi:hypothetical protein